MKTNAISNIAFKRAIQLNSDTNEMINWRTGKVDVKTLNVVKTMETDKVSFLDKEISGKIGEFLRAQIGDFDDKTGVEVRKFDGHLYVFTGDEAKRMREIDRKALREKQALETWQENCNLDGMSLKEKVEFENKNLVKNKRRAIVSKRKSKALEMVEDGRYGKPFTKISISSDSEGKPQKIEYYSLMSTGKNSRVYKTLYV